MYEKLYQTTKLNLSTFLFLICNEDQRFNFGGLGQLISLAFRKANN